MSSIFILKPIVDKLYEEMAEYNKKVEDYTVKIAKQSQEIEDKNRLIAKLSEECKKLDALLIGYEANFDLLSNTNNANDAPEVPEVPFLPHRVNVFHEDQMPKPEQVEEKMDKDTKTVDVKVKKDRRDYMREYQRNYRKKQKDITLSL